MQQITTSLNFLSVEIGKSILSVVLVALCFNTTYAQKSVKELRHEIESLEQNEKFSPKDTVYLYYLTELAFSLRNRNWDSVLLLSKKNVNLSKTAGYKRGEGYSYMALGLYYIDKNDRTKAFENFNKAYNLLKPTAYYVPQVDVLNMMAMEHLFNHEPAKSLSFFMEAIAICKENELNEMLSLTFSNLGILYLRSLNDTNQAIYLLTEANKINEGLESNFPYNITLSNLAYVYLQKGDLDKAMSHLKPSTTFFKKTENTDWLVLNYTIEAGVLIAKKKFDEALICLNKLEKLHKHIQDDESLTTFFEYKTTIFLHEKNIAAAEEYAHKSYNLSKKIQFILGIKIGLSNLHLVYKEKGDFDQALGYHEQYQSLTDSIIKAENRKNLDVLLAKVDYNEQKRKIILENEMALARQNRYITIAVIVLCIIFCAVFMIRKSTKLQEQLNVQLILEKEKLEKNEIVLKEANRTKDKLFSIIGHDLRSPIAAFQGLLRLFKDNEIDEDEFVNFVPKLEADLRAISFMLNNLLSWGRSQMNGNITKPEVMEAKSLVSENVNLLSEVSRNKTITIQNHVPDHALIWADVNQIDIVFRNLMSNALKFTTDHGVITIGTTEREDTWLFYVKDTGIGMDKVTLEKIFTENATHTTYGTHNEKGTGLGLNLCKEMVQKNKGSIWVESTPNIGSCFYFELPKEKHIYKNAG